MAFNGRFVLNIIHFAARQGAEAEYLIELSGKKGQELEQANCTISDAAYMQVIEAALDQSQDPHLGLHLGESQNLAAIGLILQIAQSSETVKQALEYGCQFANLGCSALPMSLKEEADYYLLSLQPSPMWEKYPVRALSHTAEGVLVFGVRQFQSLTRQGYQPLGIRLPWSAPADSSEYQRIFGCPLWFEEDEIAVLLPKAQVEDKVITADHRILKVLLEHAELRSAQFDQQAGFINQVRQSILNLVQPSYPSAEEVARHLNLSLRTFQRRLKEDGFTYKQLLDKLRQESALNYLKRTDLSITEVAFLLGYADSSAFSRSFKRWMGASPLEYRSKILE